MVNSKDVLLPRADLGWKGRRLCEKHHLNLTSYHPLKGPCGRINQEVNKDGVVGINAKGRVCVRTL